MIDMDELARQRISTETGTNFFVEAGAGSGKTTQLVARMTAMVKSGIDVRKICAITFTNAAAREFYKRFQASLAKAVRECKDGTERQRCAEGLRNIDLCFMGTIDSFSHLIMHEHPIEGSIPSSSAVVESKDMKAVYLREYSNIIHGIYGEELLEKHSLFSNVQNDPRKVFTAFFGTIFESRSNDIIYDKPPAGNVDEVLAEERAIILGILEHLYDHQEMWLLNQSDARKAADALKYNSKRLKESWNNNLAEIINILNTAMNLRLSCPPEEIGIMSQNILSPNISRGKITHYKFDPESNDILRPLKEYQYSATMDFLISAAEAVAKNLRLSGELTYFDYKLYLRDMLKRDAQNGGKLIRHIYDRHSYYLIDEFQDTDPMQAEIFFYLTAETPVEDWRKCFPRAGSLFIVGDPKQSIYRFRSADVASFKEVRKLFENGAGEVLELTRNYRSTNGLKSGFNEMFSALLPTGTADQSSFSCIPVSDNNDEQFSGIWSYNVVVKINSVKGEEDKVADIIQSLIGKQEYSILDKETNQLRPLRYSDFMVLVNSKKHVSNFSRAFALRAIPTRPEGSISFTDCPALMAMSDIMAAVAFPDDNTAFYGALTCFVFNIPESELIKLRKADIPLKLSYDEKIKEVACEELCYAIDTLKKLVLQSRKLSPAAVFSKAMEELRIAEKCGADSLEYLYYAIELLRDAEVSGKVMSISDSADFIRELIYEESTERSLSLQRDDNKVHIANLHKVKGLEAPVVILAHPYQMKHDPDKRSEHTPDGDTTRIFTFKDNNITYAKTEKFSAAFEREEASSVAEKLRLLYVSATRARNVLLISNGFKENGDLATNNPWEPLIQFAEGDFFECVRLGMPDEPDEREKISATELYRKGEKTVLDNTDAENPTYTLSLPSQIKLNDVISDETENDIAPAKRNAALVGTLVHRLMECLVSAKNMPSADELVSSIVNSFESSEEYGKLIRGVFERITSGGFPQKNEMPDDILAELKTADEVYCEVPFCHKNGSEIWHGIIDLLYKKNGKWRIVDYKTNAEAADLDYKYEGQLNAYKDAFHAVTGETADAFIYHIDV